MKKILLGLAVTAGVVGAIVFYSTKSDTKVPISEAPKAPALLNDAELKRLRAVFDAYETARAQLAKDELPNVARLQKSLEEAVKAAPSFGQKALKQALEAAQRLASEKDVESARLVFGEVSRALVTFPQAEERLREGLFLFSCPMAEGFAFWLQPTPRIENPYMGTRMLQCGSAALWESLPPLETLTVSHEGHGHLGSDTAYYTCPMHPSVRQPSMGKCPLCAMDLTPVTFDELEGGVVRMDKAQREKIGLQTEEVKRAPMVRELRATGKVTWDETRLRDVTVRQGGWIARLQVAATGEPVTKGQTLFTLFSPELMAAQQEYLLALKSQREAKGTSMPDRADALVAAARARLLLWDLSDATLDSIARTGKALDAVPFSSPLTGYVVEKDVVEGAAVMPGQRVFRLASLDDVWVEADIFEADLSLIRIGQEATVSVPNQPNRLFQAKVSHIHPSTEIGTKSTAVRLELKNADKVLRPDMYADVRIRIELGARLQVPTSAILYTGPRWLVFVDLGDGRLRPQEVKLGLRTEEVAEVVDGLKEGDRVVTAGNFLVAAESRLKSASKYWENTPDDAR